MSCLFCCIQRDVPLCFVGDQLPALCFCVVVVFCCIQFDVLLCFVGDQLSAGCLLLLLFAAFSFNVLLCFAGDQSSAAVLHCAPCGGRFTADEAGRGQPCLHLSAGHLQDGKEWRPKMHKAVNEQVVGEVVQYLYSGSVFCHRVLNFSSISREFCIWLFCFQD